MRRLGYWVAGLAMLPTAAEAEVKLIAANGFVSENNLVVSATPAATYAALGQIGRWWSGAHTYSGNAANLKLELRAGGCLCETVPKDGGTVEHMRVVQARPGTMLRLQGGLGPLQSQAVTGTLTWSLKAVPGGTEITQTYLVGGFIQGGAEAMALPVDQVVGEQLAGLGRFLAQSPKLSR